MRSGWCAKDASLRSEPARALQQEADPAGRFMIVRGIRLETGRIPLTITGNRTACPKPLAKTRGTGAAHPFAARNSEEMPAWEHGPVSATRLVTLDDVPVLA